jgi:hypothetical protein
MRIEQPHSLGREEASHRIDRFLDNLMRRQPPGGVTVKDPHKSWAGHTMNFSFTAAKGLFGTAIRGLMHVHDDRVVVESELPVLVKSFVGEGRIKEVISRELGRILA